MRAWYPGVFMILLLGCEYGRGHSVSRKMRNFNAIKPMSR